MEVKLEIKFGIKFGIKFKNWQTKKFIIIINSNDELCLL